MEDKAFYTSGIFEGKERSEDKNKMQNIQCDVYIFIYIQGV